MNANGKAQIAGVLLSVGIGCSSTSIERVGAATPKDGLPKDGLIRATSSKYQIFHIEWGNNAIGSLAQSRGIRYVLGSSHRKAGIPIVFNKRETTVFGFATKESFDEWKAKNSVQSKPPALETAELFEKLNRAVHQSKQSLATTLEIVFNKRETTVFGFATKESLDKLKAKNSVQSKPPALETAELFEKLNRVVHQSKQSLATTLEKLEKQYKAGKQALKLEVRELRAVDLAKVAKAELAELQALDRAEAELRALARAEAAELRALARAEAAAAELRALDRAEAELRASTMATKPNGNQIVAELRR